MTDQPNQMPVSTCPRTDRHGYHMWPERPDAPAFCPGHPAPDTAADHAYRDAVTAPLSDRDVRAINARLALGIDTRAMKAPARTTPDNPATSSDGADNSGRATVTIAVTAPDQDNADRWAETIRDHVQAEYGQTMRLDITVGGGETVAAPDICELPHRTIDEEDDCERRRVAATDDGLRELYAAAIVAKVDGTRGCANGYRLADAVLAVRDRRLEQLARAASAEKAAVDEVRDALTAAGHSRAEVSDWPDVMPALRDLIAERDRSDESARRCLDQRQEMAAERYAWQERGDRAETALAMQKGISADLRVESRARGEKLIAAEAARDRVRTLGDIWFHEGTDAASREAGRLVLEALDGPADSTPPDPLADLHTWLTTNAAHHHAAVPLCRVPEAGQAHDGIAVGLNIAARVVAGLIAGKGLPVSGRPAVAEAPGVGHGETPGDGGDGR